MDEEVWNGGRRGRLRNECYHGNTFFEWTRLDDVSDVWKVFVAANLNNYARVIERVIIFIPTPPWALPECPCHAYVLLGTRHGFPGMDYVVQDEGIPDCPCPRCTGIYPDDAL